MMRPRAWLIAAISALVVHTSVVVAAPPPVAESRGVLRGEAAGTRLPLPAETRQDGEYASSADDRRDQGSETVVAGSDSPSGRSAGPGGSGLGPVVYEQQLLRQELQELRGLVEQLSHRLQMLEREGQERYLDIDRRLQQQGGGPVESSEVTVPPSVPIGGDDAERAAYAASVELMKSRQFQAAIDSFNSFLTEFPDGRYSVNAYYWLGELYLALPQPELERARQSFSQVVNLYPDNAKVADSLYKLGIVHDRLGDRDKAREYLERVRAQFAGSTAAGLAEKQLASLP